MKLAPGTKIKDFPPKLRQLALKRSLEMNGNPVEKSMEMIVGGAFTWCRTPEGGDFWSNVDNGKEFDWQEEAVIDKWDGTGSLPERWAIKRDEDNYAEIEAWYFKYVKSYSTFPTNRSHPYLHYPLQGCGSSSSIQKGYTEISMEQFRKHVIKKAEFSTTPKQSTRFKRGDLIEFQGVKGYFVGTMNGQSIIERIDKFGWKKQDNPTLIPEDYVPVKYESYWAITLDYYKLLKAVSINYEIY